MIEDITPGQPRRQYHQKRLQQSSCKITTQPGIVHIRTFQAKRLLFFNFDNKIFIGISSKEAGNGDIQGIGDFLQGGDRQG